MMPWIACDIDLAGWNRTLTVFETFEEYCTEAFCLLRYS